MKTLHFFLFVFLIWTAALQAKTIEPSEAATVAMHYYQSTAKGSAMTESINLDLVYGNNESEQAEEQSLLYIFNVNGDDGYVIVSGDDAVTPILGFSDKGFFNPYDIPVNMAKWLEDYKHQIAYAIEQNVQAPYQIENQWKLLKSGPQESGSENNPVGPLLNTTWGQGSPYNDFCPGGSVTGCVATAMAQVMKYWEHPLKGNGFYNYFEPEYGIQFGFFGLTYYYWGSMPNNVTSTNDQVAQLMYHCGVSVDMDYSPSSSGAVTSKIAPALINYFDYDPNLNYQSKGTTSDLTWQNMLKAELDAGRPMVYRGSGSAGGHAFVCDGYFVDPFSNNLFHMNWGWNGSQDGFFFLSNLAPGNFNFNSGQSAIFGIQPDPNAPPSLDVFHQPAVSDTIWSTGEEYTVVDVIRNLSTNLTYNGKLGLGLFRVFNDEFVDVLDSVTVSIDPLGSYGYVAVGNANILPGDYYVSFVYKEVNNTTWTQVDHGQFGQNETEVFVSDGSLLISIENMTVSQSVVQVNSPVTVTAKVFCAYGSWDGLLALDLYDMEGNQVASIAQSSPLSLNLFETSNTITFYTTDLNVAPGAYRIVLKEYNGTAWKIVTAGDFPSNIQINIVPEPILPDFYENNNTHGTAASLVLPFGGSNNATTDTWNSNIHSASDVDYYKIDLPAGYDYVLTPRAHDSYNSGNGQAYTNDVKWSYSIGNDIYPFTYDDIVLSPGNTVAVDGGQTIYFKVSSYYNDTKGTYLLEIAAERTLTTSNEEVLDPSTVKAFPNPASDVVYFQLNDQSQRIEAAGLYTLEGKLLQTVRIDQSDQFEVITAKLAEGMYVLQVQTTDGIVCKQISIVH